MSSIMDLTRGPGDGALPPPPGMAPGPVPGLPMMGDGAGGPPVPPELQQLMDILGVDPSSPQAEGDEQEMSPIEHIQAAMMHLMMAFTQEGDHSKGAGIVKGMGALQGILAGAQKDQAAQAPPPTLGG